MFTVTKGHDYFPDGTVISVGRYGEKRCISDSELKAKEAKEREELQMNQIKAQLFEIHQHLNLMGF